MRLWQKAFLQYSFYYANPWWPRQENSIETPVLVSNDQFIFQIEFHCTIMTSAAVNNTAGVKSFWNVSVQMTEIKAGININMIQHHRIWKNWNMIESQDLIVLLWIDEHEATLEIHSNHYIEMIKFAGNAINGRRVF